MPIGGEARTGNTESGFPALWRGMRRINQRRLVDEAVRRSSAWLVVSTVVDVRRTYRTRHRSTNYTTQLLVRAETGRDGDSVSSEFDVFCSGTALISGGTG